MFLWLKSRGRQAETETTASGAQWRTLGMKAVTGDQVDPWHSHSAQVEWRGCFPSDSFYSLDRSLPPLVQWVVLSTHSMQHLNCHTNGIRTRLHSIGSVSFPLSSHLIFKQILYVWCVDLAPIKPPFYLIASCTKWGISLCWLWFLFIKIARHYHIF